MISSNPLRRSPLHEALQELNPVWGKVHEMQVPLRFGGAAKESQLKAELSLCDVSCFPKIGVKGPEALAWLVQTGTSVPDSVYGVQPLGEGGLAIRTDRQEVFLEDALGGQRVSQLESALQAHPPGVCLVRRRDASLALMGAGSNRVLRETCGVDFSRPVTGVVMTRVAGVSCMVLPPQSAGAPAFRFWLDPSYAPYLWEALLEIVRHHGGDAAGLEAIDPSVGKL